MHIRTWFGIFTLHEGTITDVELFPKETGALVQRLLGESLLMRGDITGKDIGDLAVTYGFVSSKEEYDRILHDVTIQLAKKQMADAVTLDRRIRAAVEAIDDINETASILAERLKEWYLLNFDETDLRGRDLAMHVVRKEEAGNRQELKMLQHFASALLGLYETRSSIEAYLEETMPVFAPNLSSIAGYILGARLVSTAGSLEKLASMPSSTIQVIGASNALFKHLKGKAPSPKHGLIFRHPRVNTAPKKLRGKIARAVASKISLASRYDYYTGEFKENLAGELETRISGIKKGNPRLPS